MSREITFRAWLKDKKKMVPVIDLDFEYQQIGIDDFKSREYGTYLFIYFRNIELMQYTGLEDKNGVKIFEGDIVKYKIGNVDFEGYVYFYDGRFEVIDFEDDEETEFLCYCDDLEVIGNIYENNELLGDNNE